MKKLLLIIRVFKYTLFSKAVDQEIKLWYWSLVLSIIFLLFSLIGLTIVLYNYFF